MKILVGLSGGVDSAYAALDLVKKGHDVCGAVLKMHRYTETDAALHVAEQIGIPCVVIDCTELFDRIVKEDFAKEYASARTPNPCIICNERVKFASLRDFAVENGYDRIATGHYARITEYAGRRTFGAAVDTRKDQSYMLYRLPEDIMNMLILPLSEVTKSEVRAALATAGIDIAEKPDSQEICFLPNGGYADFVEQRCGKFLPGSFISDAGEVLGEHKGIIHYTVGQRKGLGISLGERMFVSHINADENTVTLSKEMSGKRDVILNYPVFMGLRAAVQDPIRVYVKVRYTAPLVPASATFEGDSVILAFDEPVKAAPGQSAVAYSCDGILLFGGIIT